MKYLLYITILASTLLLYSCGPNIVYEESHTLNETWGYGDAIEFSFDIDDASTVYDILLTVNHSSDFSYQNFYTQITTTYPTAEEFTSPLSIELANKMGSWLSTCSGEKCELYLLLKNDVKFKDIGNYKISFQQDTREAQLRGINSLGLSLIETEK